MQAAGRLKKRLQQCFLRMLPEDCSKDLVFSHLYWQFFTCIAKIIVTFRERFIFQMIRLFFLFISGSYTMEPRQVDEPTNRTKQWCQVFMQAWTLQKLKTFCALFRGNTQFVQKVTFEPLMDFKQNHHRSWKYYIKKLLLSTLKSFLHKSYKNTQLLFLWQCFLIFHETNITRWLSGVTQKYELCHSFKVCVV